MKIAILGAGGRIGQRIVKEAVSRRHTVTAFARDSSRIPEDKSGATWKVADVLDPDSVAQVAKGEGVLISAYGPPQQGGDTEKIPQSARAIIEGLRKQRLSGTSPRFIMVGGAGSLEVAPGKLLVDLLPDFVKPTANAHHEALKYLLTVTDVPWTNFSPGGQINPGERTGNFRLGTDQLLGGKNEISMEDYAVAMIDEAEQGKHIGRRFTAGY
jgi:putative NADH-flavin reductase